MPVWHFADREFDDGRLLRVTQPKPPPLRAVWSTRRCLAPKLRTMIDVLPDGFDVEPRLSGCG